MNWEYLAGFLDGEGSCGCYHYRHKQGHYFWKLSCSVSQKERNILDEIKEFIGYGSIWRMRKIWCLGFNNAQAREFLKNWLFYSKSDRRKIQIRKALDVDFKARKEKK